MGLSSALLWQRPHCPKDTNPWGYGRAGGGSKMFLIPCILPLKAIPIYKFPIYKHLIGSLKSYISF